MEKLQQLYEGKAKKVFATDDPELLIVDYKDDATAFNGLKKAGVDINRKMLAELAVYNAEAFTQLTEVAKKSLS